MSIKLPKIIIKYNRFLDPIFIDYIHSIPKWKKWVVPSKKTVLKRVENYKKEWEKYEKKILYNLCKVTGLNFNRNVIDIYIVSGNPRQFSNPIIIKSGFSPTEFVDVLTHELIHRLLTINKIKKHLIVDKIYKNESDTTKNHILVHALHKYIYIDILKNKLRLRKNILRSKKHSTNEYLRAWNIVEKEGYIKLIKEFKKKYLKQKRINKKDPL